MSLFRLSKSFFLFLLFTSCSFTQQSSLSKGVNYISSFIASEYFADLSKTNNDLAMADTIYKRAVQYYDNDYSEALLTLMFAAVPYKEVPIQLPFSNIIIDYPLTAADDSIFNLKNRNLPKYFFYDSPLGNYGDKDKLAHFFGSAFLSYTSKFFDLGDIIGYFVEVFEESFKVQSSIDERDLHVNNLGNYFGEVLKNNKNLLPSRILILPFLINMQFNL